MCCLIQDSQIVLLLNKATNSSENAGDGCMIILQASDLPFVSISRSAYIHVWRLQELKASHTTSIVFIVYVISVMISVAIFSINCLSIEVQVH